MSQYNLKCVGLGGLLATNNPNDKEVAKDCSDHNEGEGQGPEHVQVGPGGGGVHSSATRKLLPR